MIQRLVPNARVGIGHGQMEGKKLEELMLAFMNGEFDVLVATTIIESGLDVPNANTIFINNANNFGLSDLHQMRGRVGRRTRRRFLFYLPYSAMTDDARRNSGIEFSDWERLLYRMKIWKLWCRFRGEQSGFINEIGFDTYQKIMMKRLKKSEFKDLYPRELLNYVNRRN
jgi:transcription-repair coupling factor (superfamily II helicase)